MAEIQIERKPRSRVGLMVLLVILIIVAAAAWWWWSNQPSATSTTGMRLTAPTTIASINGLLAERV